MKITYAKFFQPVQIERSSGGTDTMTYVREKEYNMVLDGLLLTVTDKTGSKKTVVTLHNVCFMKVEDELDTKTEKGGSSPRPTKKEQA